MLSPCTAGVIAALIALVFLIAFIKSDGDVLLMFKTTFGKQPESLAGKVVWITGASSGIGEYIAYCLAGAGCRLVLSARRKDELERVKQKCLQACKGKISENDILVLPLDVVAFDTHKAAVEQVLEYFNKIDTLINNAGRTQFEIWTEVELSVDREMFEINVLGPVSLTQEVLPHMLQRKQGHIVAISSVSGKIGGYACRSYTGSKYAIQGYFESLRTEMDQHNIDVTLICPGPVVSNIFNVAMMGKSGETTSKLKLKAKEKMPTDRCAYLASVAIANRLYEAWIAKQPVLFFLYFIQYFPDLGRWVAKKLTKEIIKNMMDTKDIYSNC